MKIINLTPHPLNIVDGEHAGTYPSAGIARVDGLPLGPVVGLPDSAPGTLFVVSVLVAEALPDRSDLRVPGRQIRSEDGRVIGCASLDAPVRCSPALARLLDPATAWTLTMRRMGATRLCAPRPEPGYPHMVTALTPQGTTIGSVMCEADDYPVSVDTIQHWWLRCAWSLAGGTLEGCAPPTDADLARYHGHGSHSLSREAGARKAPSKLGAVNLVKVTPPSDADLALSCEAGGPTDESTRQGAVNELVKYMARELCTYHHLLGGAQMATDIQELLARA